MGSSATQPRKRLGAYVNSDTNVHQALTDGFLHMKVVMDTAGTEIMELRTDGGNPPTIVRQSQQGINTFNVGSISLSCSVKKNDYYQAYQSGCTGVSIYFQPLKP